MLITKTLIVECDALGHDISAILIQEGRSHSFKRWKLKKNNLLKSIYEKEMFATLHANSKWLPFLIGIHFKVK
jgi:hypothetical protein